MEATKPQFAVGDRVFTHYAMQWGTVEKVGQTDRDRTHGVTREPLPDTTWYTVKLDNGDTVIMDDAHGNWELARIIPPHIARLYGYGNDPA